VVSYGYENNSTGLGADAASCGGFAYGERCKAITSAGNEYSQRGLAGSAEEIRNGFRKCQPPQDQTPENASLCYW
jgi:hypothetical protein